MKKRYTLVLGFFFALFFCKGEVIQVDPALTAAVVTQSEMLREQYKKRHKLQESIVTAQAAITVATNELHKVENTMLDYMKNVQDGVQNLHTIAKVGDLALRKIPANLDKVVKAVPTHLSGTAISVAISDYYLQIGMEAASLYPFVEQLVTSGSYKTSEEEKHKVNLLNSAERYYVLNEVYTRLATINTRLIILYWQIRSFEYRDLLYKLDFKTYSLIYYGSTIVKGIIRDWNQVNSR